MAERNLLLSLIISAKDNASSVVSSVFGFLDRTTSATANKIRDAFSGLFSAQGLSAASNFEEAMARVEAVMRPLPDEFQALRDKAEEMGRNTLLALKTLAETPEWEGTLTLADDRTFSVAFRDDGLTAEPVYHQTHTAALDSLPYTFTLKLMTV